MARPIFTSFLGLLLAGCMVPQTVDGLQSRVPPPEFGRPGWVRTMAGAGAWIGGIGGGVVSIVLLPVTWPLSQLCDEGLGEMSQQELMFFPAVGGAALGHFLLGTPPDAVDYVFRRAWVSQDPPPNSYELVPMEPPQGAAAASPAPTEVAPKGAPPDRK